jgi:hypothetical protein
VSLLSGTHRKAHKKLFSVAYSAKWRISVTCYKAKETNPSSREIGCYIRNIATSVQLKNILAVILKGLGSKTN